MQKGKKKEKKKYKKFLKQKYQALDTKTKFSSTAT
jgi:hypothetical protein